MFTHGKHHNMHIAKAHYDAYGGPTVNGHGHREDYYQGPRGTSISVGCMARIWDLRYDRQRTAKKKHRNGWAYGVIDSKTGRGSAWTVKREAGTWISPMGNL